MKIKTPHECRPYGPKRKKVKILLSTGEVSGDLIGASLSEALRGISPDVDLHGVGGARMRGAGVRVLLDTNPLGSVGISEPLVTLPGILRAFRAIHADVEREKPDAAVLIGHEVFNLILARSLRAKGIPVIAYFPPQIWIWRSLARPIARCYDWILTSFREEHQVYEKAGGRVVFVGHYLLDQVDEVSPEVRGALRHALGLHLERPLVGLLPGSRWQEIHKLAPVLLDAALQMLAGDPSIRFLLPVADAMFEEELRQMVRQRRMESCLLLTRDGKRGMAACDLVMVCSGTATLEAAIMGIPMVISYQVSKVSWLAVKVLDATHLIASKTSGLPNLLAGKIVVPELIQYSASPETLASEALSILSDKVRQLRIKRALRLLSSELGERGALERAARAIFERAIGIRDYSPKFADDDKRLYTPLEEGQRP